MVGGSAVNSLTLPALMTGLKKMRNAMSGDRSSGEEQGRVTSASSPEGSPPTESIPLRRTARHDNDGDNGGTSSNNRV